MTTATNDITGDSISNTKGDATAYAVGWDAIWSKPRCYYCDKSIEQGHSKDCPYAILLECINLAKEGNNV